MNATPLLPEAPSYPPAQLRGGGLLGAASCSGRVFALIAECVPDAEWFFEDFPHGELLASSMWVNPDSGYVAILVEVKTFDLSAIQKIAMETPGATMMAENIREVFDLREWPNP